MERFLPGPSVVLVGIVLLQVIITILNIAIICVVTPIVNLPQINETIVQQLERVCDAVGCAV